MTRPDPLTIMPDLWRGQSFGFYCPSTRKSGTSHKPLERKHWWRHLRPGTDWTLGRHPLLANNTCGWGVIDYDRRDLTDAEAQAMATTSRKAELPLLVTLSKSRGAHLWAFLTEPQPAETVRRVLYHWATAVFGWRPKKPGDSKDTAQFFEIFPKRDTWDSPFAGGWVNLCYSGGADSERYAVSSRGRESLEWFLRAAVHRRLTPDVLAGWAAHAAPIPPDAFGGALPGSGAERPAHDLDGAMLTYPMGRNETMLRCLARAHWWGWSPEALDALAWTQYDQIPQGSPFNGDFERREVETMLRQVAKYDQASDLLLLNPNPTNYERALDDLERIGWDPDAIDSAWRAEMET